MTGWLIFLSCILIIVVLFQVTRTLDLVSQLRAEERTTEGMSKFHGILLVLFMIFGVYGFFYCFGHYKNKFLPPSASEHGLLIEKMFFWTIVITVTVCIVCNVLLFSFSYIYRHTKTRQAVHFSHSNKLEFIWTIIPTIVLTALVVFGLQAWTKIMAVPEDSENALTFEMTGQQFFWTSRYGGPDQKLGITDYNLICAQNPLGIISREYVEHRLHTLNDSMPVNKTDGEITKLRRRMAFLPHVMDSLQFVINGSINKWRVQTAQSELDELSGEYNDIPEHISIRQKTALRIKDKYTEEYFVAHAEEMQWGYDDFMPSELHLPVNRLAFTKIVALDVLHDFYVPHMKVKMDAVPGMPTSFKFKPIITTEEMREELSKNPEWQVVKEGQKVPKYKDFNYEVACAELCGKGHNSMKYILIVESEEEYETWAAAQKTHWSQVVNDLILDNGVSSLAPRLMPSDTIEVPAVDTMFAMPDGSIKVSNSDTAGIKADSIASVPSGI